VIRDRGKQQLAYVYSNEPAADSAAKLLTKDEARRDLKMEERSSYRGVLLHWAMQECLK